jgi:hypothetical protein
MWNMEHFYAYDLFGSAPHKQGCQGRRRRKQPADSKNCNNILFYFLCIEGHNRVPSLVNHVLMRYDAFRIEVIEIRWRVPWDHAMPLSNAGTLSYLNLPRNLTNLDKVT